MKNNCPKGYKQLSLLLFCSSKHPPVLPGVYLTLDYPSVAFSHFLFPGWEHMKTASVLQFLYAAFQAKPENTASVGIEEEDAEEEDREE